MDCMEMFQASVRELVSRTQQRLLEDEADAKALVESKPSDKEMSDFYIRIGQPPLCKKDGFPYTAKCRWAHKLWMWTVARAEERQQRDAEFELRQKRKRSAMNACIRKRAKMAEAF